jgi:hypothetical protein
VFSNEQRLGGAEIRCKVAGFNLQSTNQAIPLCSIHDAVFCDAPRL